MRGRTVTILELRPPWSSMLGPEWTTVPIAQLRYAPPPPARGRWQLYWADRNSRWHRYQDLDPGTAQVLLDEIDQDPTCIFWG